MFKIRLLLMLPLLALVLPIGALIYVSHIEVRDAEEALQSGFKHAAELHLEIAKRQLLEIEAKTASSLAAEMAKGRPFAESGDPDLRKKLAAATGGSPKNFAAVFDTSLRALGSFPVEPNLEKACSNAITLREAASGMRGASLELAGGWAFFLSAAPIVADGSTAGVLCFLRRIDDNTARDLKKVLGYDVTLMYGGKLLGTTLRETFPQFLPEIMLKRTDTFRYGRLAGKDAPLLASAPLLIASDTFVNLSATNGGISVTFTSPLDLNLKDTRDEQLLWIVFSAVAFLLSLAIAVSVYTTTRRSLNLCRACLSMVSAGNLQAQVAPQKLAPPFSDLGDAINHAIFSMRERAALFAPKKKPDLDDLLGAPRAEQPTEEARAEGLSVPTPEPAGIAREQRREAARPGIKHGSAMPEPAPDLELLEKIAPEAYVEVKTHVPSEAPPREPSLPPVVMEHSQPPHAPPEEESSGPKQTPMPAEQPKTAPPQEESELPPTQAVQIPPQLLQSLLDADVLNSVFEEFLEMRRRLGERVDTIPRDRFLERLKKTRADVMAKTGCREVKFSVYDKDGKASIKATPYR